MGHLGILFIILFQIMTSPIKAEVSSLNSSEIEGLMPSFWLDRTGFKFFGEPDLEEDVFDQKETLPLFPIFKSGGFGKSVYVGVILDKRYLEGKKNGVRREILKKISELQTPNGIGLRAVEFNGNIYGIRSDYQIVFQNSKTIGISLSFGSKNQVILGEEETWGLSLDLHSPIKMSTPTGYNGFGMLQKIVDDWSIGMSEDESRLIVEQAVRITPLLMDYYFIKSSNLFSEQGDLIEPLHGKKNDLDLEGMPSVKTSIDESKFSKEFTKLKKGLLKGLSKEMEWRHELTPQIQSEKIYDNIEDQKLIQSLCDKISATYEMPQELWPRCRISASLVPNAWAYPGGDIFISTGLLGILSEIDSASLVLAHEIGHVMGRHGTRELKSKKNFSYAATYLSTVVNLGLLGLSASSGVSGLGNIAFLSGFSGVLATQVTGNYLLEKGSEIAGLAPLAGLMLKSRDLELEADRIGQEAAFASGAEIDKMKKGWEEYINYYEEFFPHEKSFTAKLMSSHPTREERAIRMNKNASLLDKKLSELNKKHSFDEDFRDQYKKIHKKFRIYSRAFGKNLQKKSNTDDHNKISSKHKFLHFMQTMTGPHGLCVQHALGAE